MDLNLHFSWEVLTLAFTMTCVLHAFCEVDLPECESDERDVAKHEAKHYVIE